MRHALLIQLNLCCILLVIIFSGCHARKAPAAIGARSVQVIPEGNGFRLYRNGQPYKIKGACILHTTYLAQAKSSGANSVRTYSTDHAKAILDSAQQLGLTVTLGLHLPYAGIEMSYRDKKAVAKQLELVRKEVMRYKDHPALLMWGVGNELSLYLSNTAIAEYIALAQTIQQIAKMIHEIDPNHPTTTTLPFVRKNMITVVDKFCDDIDVISLNSFQGMEDLPSKARKYNKPYVISEYGAYGYWISELTDWNTRIEQTSGEKAAFIMEQSSLLNNDTGRYLGSYIFVWDYKLEYTSTWFSLLGEDGKATSVTDALQYIWTGQWPAERGPVLYSVKINGQKSAENIYLRPGQLITASITTDTGQVHGLSLTTELQPDNLEAEELYGRANYKQDKSPNLLPDSLSLPLQYKRTYENGRPRTQIDISFTAPAAQGPYRLFLYLHNRTSKVATANACFYVHD